MVNLVGVAYVTDITDDVEHDGCKDIRGSSKQQSDILAEAQWSDNGTNPVSQDIYYSQYQLIKRDNSRKEVDSWAHSLTHAHAPNQSPDLGVHDCEFESFESCSFLVGFTGSGFHLDTPDCVVALYGFEEASVVWIFGHEHGGDETASDCRGSLPVTISKFRLKNIDEIKR